MKIEFGSRWISKGQCKARIENVGEQGVTIRWEGSFDDCLTYTRADFLEKFREILAEEAVPTIKMGTLWWLRGEDDELIRGVVVGVLDGRVLLQVDNGDDLHINPINEFEGYGDDYIWNAGTPCDESPRAEMEAKMAAIQAGLDELKRLLGK
jgi:hypothetical protein